MWFYAPYQLPNFSSLLRALERIENHWDHWTSLRNVFWAFLGSAGQMAFRRPLEPHFQHFWAQGRQVALRRPLETHFEHFWAQFAKWLSGGLWKLILSISRLRWLNGSQEVSGGSFWVFLGSVNQMAPSRPLEAHFQHFWVQLAKWLSGRFWRLNSRISELSSPNDSQEASGSLF